MSHYASAHSDVKKEKKRTDIILFCVEIKYSLIFSGSEEKIKSIN